MCEARQPIKGQGQRQDDAAAVADRSAAACGLGARVAARAAGVEGKRQGDSSNNGHLQGEQEFVLAAEPQLINTYRSNDVQQKQQQHPVAAEVRQVAAAVQMRE